MQLGPAHPTHAFSQPRLPRGLHTLPQTLM